VKRGYSLYVASNGGALYVQRVLEIHGIQSYFDGIYSAGLYQTKSKVELVSMLLEDAGKAAL
jgi:FMN phosphatase YigB (HAD superfamily)